MNKTTGSIQRFPNFMLLLLIIGIIASCNLRENTLLPPNITPEDYIQSSLITSKASHLVKSTNDNSFLLIDKQAIADSTIHIGDEIVFQKSDSFTDRDTIHIAYDKVISPSISLYVKRNGVYIALTFEQNYPYITCYTDMKNDYSVQNPVYCLNMYSWLDGKVSNPIQYAKNRISFHPYGTGSNQLYTEGSSSTSVSFTADTGNHYVWMNSTQDRVSFFLPVTVDNTEIDISSVTQLDSVSTGKVQGVFPDFALFSSIINVQSSQVLGNSISAPLMKMHNNNLSGKFPLQWIVVAPNQLFAWQESPETWVMTGNDLIAPCRVNGSYMLIIPLESQNGFNLPLDAGLKQIYAHKYWFDLKDVNLSGVTFNIDFDFTPSSAYQSYFSGKPYTLTGQSDKLKLSFYQNGTLLYNLPSSAWIEMGFIPTNYSTDKDWIRYYESSTEDFISYKTYSGAYDADYYTYSDGFVYTSITGSGDYTLGSMTTSNTSVEIPFQKPNGQLQISDSNLSWDSIPSDVTLNIDFDFSDSAGYQKYFSGNPYTLNGPKDKYKFSFMKNGAIIDDLPASNWVEFAFNPQSFNSDMKWIRYHESASEDLITYKTYASVYDATHYSYVDELVYTSIIGSGDYTFSRMSVSSSSISIPFLKSSGQYFLGNKYIAWTDLPAGITATLDFDFTPSSGYQNYFSGHPYTLSGASDKYRLSFYQNGTKLTNLPNSSWIEFGFSPTSYNADNRWIRFCESSTEDFVTYKSSAVSYDATHYSYIDGFVYASIIGSGDYIFSQMSISDAAVEIPVLKTIGEFQMDKAFIAWDNTQAKVKKKQLLKPINQKKQRTDFTSVVLDFTDPYAVTHPWLNGYPFKIQYPYKIMTAYFKVGNSYSSEVPPYFYLDYVIPNGYNPQNMVLFSDLNSNYTATYLTKSSVADYEHFTQTDNRIVCYPAFGGSLIHGDITNLNSTSFDFRMYQKMSINFDQVKMWMNSVNPVGDGLNLAFNLTSAFNDPQGILSSQYNLTQTSPAYNISLANAKRGSRGFFDDNQPLVYLRRNAVRNERLFALIQDNNYRIYPYGQADVPDGWNYSVEGDYNSFYLVHNGQFATFTDNSQHSIISKTVTSGTSAMVLSLYQAEFFLPQYFFDNATPVGTRVTLENVTDLSALPSALAATKLTFLNTMNQPIPATNFLSGYVTTDYPLLYVPFPYANAGQDIHFYHKNAAGVTTEYTLVTAFSANALTEFKIVGNCVICFPNNPGTYFTTVGAR